MISDTELIVVGATIVWGTLFLVKVLFMERRKKNGRR